MSNDSNTNAGSAGRGRGHSFRSLLGLVLGNKGTDDVPKLGPTVRETQHKHPSNAASRSAASVPHALEESPDATKSTPSISIQSSSTTALQHDGKYVKVKGALAADPITADEPVPRSSPITIKSSHTFPEVGLSQATTDSRGQDLEEGFEKGLPGNFTGAEASLRKWCTGFPPKRSYLRGDENTPLSLRQSRRSTLDNQPNPDSLLTAALVVYNGHPYLPLTAITVDQLSHCWENIKPATDLGIFRSMMIDEKINAINATHAVATLEQIGGYCSQLLILAPILTQEFGKVFDRGSVSTGPRNDWEDIIGCFPNLRRLVYAHPTELPSECFIDTFSALHTVVANRQAARALNRFDFRGPPGMLANFAHNGTAVTTTATTDLAVTEIDD